MGLRQVRGEQLASPLEALGHSLRWGSWVSVHFLRPDSFTKHLGGHKDKGLGGHRLHGSLGQDGESAFHC